MKTDLYLEVDSRSMSMSEKRYGYVLEAIQGGRQAEKKSFGRMEGTYNCVTLEALTDALAHFNRPAEICIHMQCPYVCVNLKNLQKWADNGFVGRQKTTLKHRERWKKIWDLTQGHKITVIQGEHKYSETLRKEMWQQKTIDLHI